MRYLMRSIKTYILPSAILFIAIFLSLTILCFITSTNTAICNQIEIWIEACSYVDFFLPLIVCIAFSPFFYFIERKGFLKYAAVRVGRRRFLMTHFGSTSICVVTVVLFSYYASLCVSMKMTPETTIPDNRLIEYVFGEYEVYHPYIFGLIWCLYKGVVASLFVMFGNLLALYSDNLFVSAIGPFIYCMAENMITALLNIPMYSITTAYVLNRLSPKVMHVHNYLIGCITYILITLGIVLIIWRKKENAGFRNKE